MKTGIGRKEAQEAQKRRGGFFNREGREGTRSLGESGGMMNGLGIVAHGGARKRGGGLADKRGPERSGG